MVTYAIYSCEGFSREILPSLKNQAMIAADSDDQIVLPSRQEGLPRALIEAMANSLCCVGTDVGGVSELLSRPLLCKSGSVEEIVSAIRLCMVDEKYRQKSAAANFGKSKQYSARVLDKKRREYYKQLVSY